MQFKITIADGCLSDHLAGLNAKGRNFELLRLATNGLKAENASLSLHQISSLQEIKFKEAEMTIPKESSNDELVPTVNFGDTLFE